ncbi:Stp1/IreP family PP2C-type Ser/Thr phosphatase [Mollicutes bacterium LVI A0078]|nr:Stp1/IreP family PP2C-type Ser/Thr phosphatase [Mollicutes bacterium LVI A0075]WOO90789.1 Stp1/IreP family PP2C-type Ser/Thr phosphatase [Mollicutes bacterium LVI A0078]
MLKHKGITDVGTVRGNNEDTYLICENRLKDNLFLIADGMGGHNAGEVASAMAARTVRELFLDIKAEVDYNDFLRDAIQLANDKVYKASLIDSQYNNMGTTLSVLIISRDRIFIGHVGDSRIYYMTQNTIQQLTTDHTLVQAMIDSGSITKEEAKTNNYRNVLTQAIGTSRKVTISLIESKIPMRKEIKFLLCSDGLTEGVEDEIIHKTMTSSSPLEDKLDKLMNIALNSSSKDNITFIGVEKGGVSR